MVELEPATIILKIIIAYHLGVVPCKCYHLYDGISAMYILQNSYFIGIILGTAHFWQPTDKGWVSAEIGTIWLLSTIPINCIALTLLFRELKH